MRGPRRWLRRAPGTVLFSVHTAARVGPPIVLLHYLRWLAEHTDIRVEVLLWNGGPLEPEFAALGRVHNVDHLRDWPLPAGLERLHLRRPAGWLRGARLRWWLWRIPRLRTVCIVCVSPWPVLRYVAPRHPTVVTLVHELDLQLVHLDHDGGRVRRRTDRWIAGGQKIRERLVAHDVPEADIGLAHEFVDIEVPPPDPAAVARADLGIGDHDVVVGACGVLEWRKAPDLFVQFAAAARRRHPEVPLHFVWIGGDDPGLQRRLDADVRRAGLTDRVHFVGRQDNRWDWYRLFDLFVLSSREDAFPLVCLENAALETPIVCFDAGGMPEFVSGNGGPPEGVTTDTTAQTPGSGGDSGVVVAFPDVEAMADAVAELARSPERRACLGRRGAERVRTRHSVPVGAPALHAEMEPWLP